MLVGKNVTLEFISLLLRALGALIPVNSTGKSTLLIFVSILKVSARRPKPLLLLSLGRNH